MTSSTSTHPSTGLPFPSTTSYTPTGTASNLLLELLCDSTHPLEVPMCRRCSSQLSRELARQLGELEAECGVYSSALKELMAAKRGGGRGSGFNAEVARDQLMGLEQEERELVEQLTALETEERALSAELDQKLKERRELADSDETLYRRLRDNHRALIEGAEEQRSVKAQMKYEGDQLQRLQRINPLDMAFFIWIDGEYGTINGLR
jgi:beclin 1